MERLTIRSGEVVWLKKGELRLEPCEIISSFDARDVLMHLAAYEDTGLTPEEIVALAGEVNIWKGGYYDLLKKAQQGVSMIYEAIRMIYEAIRKIPDANKQESEG